ncbi:coiled-coil and C2 domain-containing protein 1-like isoform X1 [Tribolium castaneum]|uniref:coiled-coil and C2 domain-containing protein 1-like isoform X1 n=1 Tax=Tribolium castaneum TaxID=7070 RepID=UPI00046BFA1A|nr:PREDICTED: coiled-coil and C2 domain-containing protein 1-like isoform X1 [Tribolium castaneum]|eukprot:XP_008193260.1 PREDICTED: coiled-coil and C2 domain-containing protein 1-like isoform X1 [Tribolium castaneum]
MFGAKKSEKTKRDHSGRNLSQYGLFDVSADFNLDGGLMDGGLDNENDSDLEAELAALTQGGGGKPKRPPRKKVPDADLDAMVAESMKDIPSDEELSGDDDDPELLNELSNIAGDTPEKEEEDQPSPARSPEGSSDIVKLLNDRLKMYEEAEKNAKAAGESSRARRFGRGLKTLKDLIKQANAGRPINNDDIPPEVSTGVKKPPATDDTTDSPPQPSRAAPPVPVQSDPEPEPEPEKTPEETPQVDPQLIHLLTERKNQYKIAALKAKKSGDNATAISYIKIAKQFETVIAAAQSGQPVDLSRMPGPPQEPVEKVEENKTQNDSVPQSDEPEADETLITASSVEEALEQRLAVYKKQEESAKEQGNASKARRMGRIVKQYEQAIKAHKAGKPIPVDELPTPPGYAPIPVPGSEAPKPTPAAPEQPPRPKTSPKTQPSTSQSTRISGNHVPNSRADKQLVLLLAKQKQFKEAALAAKRKGEIDQAKEYLRTAKGFDPLIDAASCGLPVDLSTLPVSPSAKSQLDNEYEMVMADECSEDDNSNTDVIARLENQLTKQLKMCLSTRDHHKALGDVAGTNRFERLALNVTKDLDIVRLARRTPGAGVPKFHYENRDFSIVKSFTELGENDLELTIVRGISYTCSNPKEIDTYVKFDFPYPQDEPFSQRTATVKDTNSPEYNATYTIPIQRNARVCQRVFKRQSVKFEVYSKGCWCASDFACCFSGFFRGDTLIGTATVKLQPLETQCELHDSFDLLEGRKKIGGKLEVRMRLRHPIVNQQVEQLHEKWLVIDNV